MEYSLNTTSQLRPLLISLRKKNNLGQEEAGAKVGLSQRGYARIEANPEKTSYKRIFEILQALGVKTLFIDEEKSQDKGNLEW